LAATSTKFGPVAAVVVAIVIEPEPVVTTPDITIGTPATFAVAVMTDPETEYVNSENSGGTPLAFSVSVICVAASAVVAPVITIGSEANPTVNVNVLPMAIVPPMVIVVTCLTAATVPNHLRIAIAYQLLSFVYFVDRVDRYELRNLFVLDPFQCFNNRFVVAPSRRPNKIQNGTFAYL
jgi:hypothetical protein